MRDSLPSELLDAPIRIIHPLRLLLRDVLLFNAQVLVLLHGLEVRVFVVDLGLRDQVLRVGLTELKKGPPHEIIFRDINDEIIVKFATLGQLR